EGTPSEVAQHGRVARPQEPGDHVEADEAVPGPLEQAAGEHHHRASTRAGEADEDEIAASLLDLLLRPVDPLAALTCEPAGDDSVAGLPYTPAPRVVAPAPAGGGAEDHEPEHEITGRGEHAREDDGRLAGDER